MTDLTLPDCSELLLDLSGGVLAVTLNRPARRNAMNLAMVRELLAVFDAIRDHRSVRAVVLSGAGDTFCAGADVKDILAARAAAAQSDSDPYFDINRSFGTLLASVDAAPQVVIAVLRGSVLGGGLGLTCVSDIAIADGEAEFAMPETSLGIPPAQIAPFVVRRIGLTRARLLALTGARVSGEEAGRIGLVHFTAAGNDDIAAQLEAQLALVRRCAPGANAMTKEILMSAGNTVPDSVLDQAARAFSAAIRGDEGSEGTAAFAEKRRPRWAAR